MEQNNPLRFTASVAKVTTMADGGLRVLLDLPEQDIDIAAALMRVKQAGGVLEVAAVAVVSKLTKVDDEAKEGAKGKGTRVNRRRR